VARQNGPGPGGLAGKGWDDFGLIFLFTFFIKEKSKCLPGKRAIINI